MRVIKIHINPAARAARPAYAAAIEKLGRRDGPIHWISEADLRSILAAHWPERLTDLPPSVPLVPLVPSAPPKPLGLGDGIAKIAQPIAKTVDAILGTNLKNCGGCKKRQARLNQIAPKLLP